MKKTLAAMTRVWTGMQVPFWLGLALSFISLLERVLGLGIFRTHLIDQNIVGEMWAPTILTVLLAVWSWDYGWSIVFNMSRSKVIRDALTSASDSLLGFLIPVLLFTVIFFQKDYSCDFYVVFIALTVTRFLSERSEKKSHISNKLTPKWLGVMFLLCGVYGLLFALTSDLSPIATFKILPTWGAAQPS